jgi:hypothetical protein
MNIPTTTAEPAAPLHDSCDVFVIRDLGPLAGENIVEAQ